MSIGRPPLLILPDLADGASRPAPKQCEVLKKGQAGLVVVYATNMADQIAANIKAVDRFVSKEIESSPDELVRQLREAHGGGS